MELCGGISPGNKALLSPGMKPARHPQPEQEAGSNRLCPQTLAISALRSERPRFLGEGE